MNNITLKLILLIVQMIHSQLMSEIEKLELRLPASFGEEKGTGSALDPLRKDYPVLDGLYSVATVIDNIIYTIEDLAKIPSQE